MSVRRFLWHLLRQVVILVYSCGWLYLASKERVAMLGLWLVVEWVNVLEGGRVREGGGKCTQAVPRSQPRRGWVNKGTHARIHTVSSLKVKQCNGSEVEGSMCTLHGHLLTCPNCVVATSFWKRLYSMVSWGFVGVEGDEHEGIMVCFIICN